MNEPQAVIERQVASDVPAAVVGPPSAQDIALQDALLPGVSRTFALTIPQLPEPLRVPVTNAYLLCRIADTIEDEPTLSADEKRRFQEQFVAAVNAEESAAAFVAALHPHLSAATIQAEHDLISHAEQVLSTTHALPPRQRDALQRCVTIMCNGMSEFQDLECPEGLADLKQMERYCYFVAGVVGEMLTELFCDYSDDIESNRSELMNLAVEFGQGLQMTNILKDIQEDRSRDVCWLPRDVFDLAGCDLSELESSSSAGFVDGLNELIGVAHLHLRNALSYTQLIPSAETGIRRFCLWAIGMAVLTLRKIHQNPNFATGTEVKISRRAVKSTILTANLAASSNAALKVAFRLAARGLPLAAETGPAAGASGNG